MLLLNALLILSPDPKLTPGLSASVSQAELCKPGYTATVRNVSTKTKLAVCKSYGLPDCGGHKVDHLIPLECGGANDVKNLWPEETHQAAEKDKLEKTCHEDVCKRNMAIPDAQKKMLERAKVLFKKPGSK